MEGNYSTDTNVEIVANANEGFISKNLGGASTPSSNCIILIMNSNIELTAFFEKLDSDSDGVSNDIDECLNTVEGETVDENGCSSLQVDSDGVLDSVDQCADTPDGESADENGCSTSQVDSDSDGVFDSVEKCSDSLDSESIDYHGCSTSQVDSDGDGVIDSVDQCSDTPNGKNVDENGCSIQEDSDSYGDGVLDLEDQCSDTPDVETVDECGCSSSQIVGDDLKAQNFNAISNYNGEEYIIFQFEDGSSYSNYPEGVFTYFTHIEVEKDGPVGSVEVVITGPYGTDTFISNENLITISLTLGYYPITGTPFSEQG